MVTSTPVNIVTTMATASVASVSALTGLSRGTSSLDPIVNVQEATQTLLILSQLAGMKLLLANQSSLLLTIIFPGPQVPALLPSCVQEEDPVTVENVFVTKATPRTSTDSFVSAMTTLVTAHCQALCVVDMDSVSVDSVNVMQGGQVLHVTVGMM